MKHRCTNPSNRQYPDYGGRGIAVCDRWLVSFDAFLNDMGPRPTAIGPTRGEAFSLDRYDNSLGYTPENCRWATFREQNNNTRSNRKVAVGGIVWSLKEACEHFGVTLRTFYRRVESGMSEEAALTTPLQR